MSKYSGLFASLDESLQLFIKEIKTSKLNKLATDKWNVKDVLCHITYWHGYYAKQYKNLAESVKPFVFPSRGGSTRNQEGVQSLENKSKAELIKMLKSSQSSLRKSITVNEVPGMDYTDRKHYNTEDFLDIVTRHIKRHTIQISKAK